MNQYKYGHMRPDQNIIFKQGCNRFIKRHKNSIQIIIVMFLFGKENLNIL